MDLEVTAKEFDHVELREMRAGFDGAELSLNGSVAGMRGFLENHDTPLGRHLGPLFLKLRSRAAVDLSKFRDLLQSYGVQGSGRAELALSVLKKEQGPVDVQVRLNPQAISMTKHTTRLVNLNGGFNIRKVLEWMPGQNRATPGQVVSPSTILPGLRSYSSQQRDLKIERVDLGFLTISDLSGWLEFDRNQLLVQNLAMNLLEGGLGGTLILTSGTFFGIETKLEFAQLNLNDLLPPERNVQGDSRVDGLLNLTVGFKGNQGNIDLGRTQMDLYLTRIGRDALDRLLLFIDPQNSNPSIVGVRSAVQLANPKKVRVTFFKGMMGLKIEFQEGLLSSFTMQRVPVGKIALVRNVTQTIPKWEMIRQMMRLLGADRYGVDQEGNIILQ